MLRLYHVLFGAILLVVLTPLGFVKYVFPYLSSNNEFHSTSYSTSAQANAAQNQSQKISRNTQLKQENIWKSLLGKTAAPPGWRVAACDGNAPFLCVSSNSKNLGTVEIGVYPIKNLPNFQQMLKQVGIPLTMGINYQNPNYQTQLASALKLWVNEHYTVLEKDRRNVYGDRIVFSTKLPELVSIGNLQGIRYGFSGIQRQGGIHEQHLGYVVFDGKALYVMTTAFDPGSETGKFDKLENLHRFEPFLSATIKNMNFPK